VYLVAKRDGGGAKGLGTAWAFAPGKLATTAHVTQAIKGHESEFVLVGPSGDSIAIRSAVSHPGYTSFKAFKSTLGGTSSDQLDAVNAYDVGVIESATPLSTSPSTGETSFLALATENSLEGLEVGAPVASAGLPAEGLAAPLVTAEAPTRLYFGNISALTDVFMVRSDPAESVLIQTTIQAPMSGAPLIDSNGQVIGILSGGNTSLMSVSDDDSNLRTPRTGVVNYAQRIDLLQELVEGTAAGSVSADEAYWQQAAKRFESQASAEPKDPKSPDCSCP
jgi:hypothetical protein